MNQRLAFVLVVKNILALDALRLMAKWLEFTLYVTEWWYLSVPYAFIFISHSVFVYWYVCRFQPAGLVEKIQAIAQNVSNMAIKVEQILQMSMVQRRGTVPIIIIFIIVYELFVSVLATKSPIWSRKPIHNPLFLWGTYFVAEGVTQEDQEVVFLCLCLWSRQKTVSLESR